MQHTSLLQYKYILVKQSLAQWGISNCHRPFKRMLLLLGLVGCIVTGQADDQKVGEQDIAVLSQALSHGGIQELLAVAQSHRIASPCIHSDYWVQLLAKQNAQKTSFERMRRNFGRQLAVALEGEARRLRQPMPSGERALSAEKLFDLSDWLKTTIGYGNYFLIGRCLDVATVPLGYLIADVEYPVTTIETLMKRILPKDGISSIRFKVLNQEAPDQRFKESILGGPARVDQLERLWSDAYKKVVKWEAAHQLRPIPNGQERRNRLPAELQYYCDDDLDGRHTLVAQWDLKMHYAFVIGSYNAVMNLYPLKSLLIYRQKVGHFPKRAEYTEEDMRKKELGRSLAKQGGYEIIETKYDSQIEEAFAYAWRPYDQKVGISSRTAAYAYQQVINGKWCDCETRMGPPSAEEKSDVTK